jgi:hypothetical protein
MESAGKGDLHASIGSKSHLKSDAQLPSSYSKSQLHQPVFATNCGFIFLATLEGIDGLYAFFLLT